MPYKNIHWIKLEKRLLNDYRFYTLSEEAQLIYLKFLMLAAETGNKMPKNPALLRQVFRTRLNEKQIEDCLVEIKKNYPKFKENNSFYYFREWSNRCNFVTSKELLRKSPGDAGDGTDKNRIDKITLDKIIEEYITLKKFPTTLPDGSKDKELISHLYQRNGKVIVRLVALAHGDVNKIIESMRWFGGICDKKALSWTLETIEKWFPEFLVKGKSSSYDRLLENFKLKPK